MKYIDKFPNMKYIDDICDGMLRGQRPQPCIICGELTEFVEINYEAHFCSEECVAKMDRMSKEAILKAERNGWLDKL